MDFTLYLYVNPTTQGSASHTVGIEDVLGE